MHAADALKQLIRIMRSIDDTSPLGAKEGRVKVALNNLANEICCDLDREDCDEQKPDEWLKWAIIMLPECVAHFDGTKGDGFSPRKEMPPPPK